MQSLDKYLLILGLMLEHLLQENGGCTPRPHSQQRRLADPGVSEGVLQDISPGRAAELGIDIAEDGYERDGEDENDIPALDRLRLVSSSSQPLIDEGDARHQC